MASLFPSMQKTNNTHTINMTLDHVPVMYPDPSFKGMDNLKNGFSKLALLHGRLINQPKTAVELDVDNIEQVNTINVQLGNEIVNLALACKITEINNVTVSDMIHCAIAVLMNRLVSTNMFDSDKDNHQSSFINSLTNGRMTIDSCTVHAEITNKTIMQKKKTVVTKILTIKDIKFL